ncbi:MAG: hypothetical protein ABI812_10515 [Betaproteobacteria bacterium]
MTDVDAALERAAACERRVEFDAARTWFERILSAAPGHPEAHAGLARSALRRGDLTTARTQACAGLATSPSHGGLLLALGQALRAAFVLAAAVEALGAATQAAPSDPSAWMALGNACMDAEMAELSRGRARKQEDAAQVAARPLLERAMEAFGQAASMEPRAAAPVAHLAMAARYACAFERAGEAERRLVERYAVAPEAFAFSPMMAVALLAQPQAQRAALRGWSAATLPPAAPRAPARLARRGDRLRVGYLSTDFHDHATAHLAAGLFELHDRARIETFAYAADHDDGSPMRQRLTAAFEHWRDVRALPDDAAARRIAADSLDVLVDLKGHTHGTRIAILASRPAPVQLHYLGFPATLACGAIDGFVADAIVAPPGSEAQFAEPLLRLPRCYQVNDHRRPLPVAPDRRAVGLPDDALVLASFNQTYKLSKPFVTAWLDALQAHGDAVLWLAVPHELARRNLLALAQRAGVAARVVCAPIVPQAEHIARLRCADLALDVLPYGSHTTGSDALWAGVPLVTCLGATFAGRVGASLCDAVRLPELVADSFPAYVALLDALCGDRARIAHYRRHLDTQRARLPLFDTQGFTTAFERLLEAAANGPLRA